MYLFFFMFLGFYCCLVLYIECYFSEIYKFFLIVDDLFVFVSLIVFEYVFCLIVVLLSLWDEKIYWIDLRFRYIVWVNFDGIEEEIIFDNVIYLLGLVVDSLGWNIYFIDKIRKIVEVVKLDGFNRKVLI